MINDISKSRMLMHLSEACRDAELDCTGIVLNAYGNAVIHQFDGRKIEVPLKDYRTPQDMMRGILHEIRI